MRDTSPGRRGRGAPANAGMFLAALLLDVLPAGYAWLAVGVGGWAAAGNGEEPTVPVAELLASGGVLLAVAGALAWGRFRAAAAAQTVLTVALMAWLLSTYHR